MTGRAGRPLVLTTILAGLDVATKTWAERALALHEPVPVFGETVRLTLGYNSGSAFGMFRDGGLPLLLLTAAMSVGLAGLVLVGPQAGVTPPIARALGLMLGGAAANVVDRWPDGRVTDFLDVGLGALRWPTFNLADSFIVLGAGLIVFVSFAAPTRAEATAA